MAKNDIIKVHCFNTEMGTLGWDEHKSVSYFQYHPEFLKNDIYPNLIPKTGIIKPVSQVQVFKKYNNETFRGLPPLFADSLPDMFGNIIFKSWMESNNRDFEKISVIEQLAYVADRGMGALEYQPKKPIPSATTIDIEEIVDVLKSVLEIKKKTSSKKLDHQSLLNIFKIGTSAGGARPKILISQKKSDGTIIPGDINYENDYEHLIVKLNLDVDDVRYNREVIEYCYYLTATRCEINMKPSKLIDGRHFATQRFDRIEGEKIHMLTASGMTGWDFKDPSVSSYENLFELSIFLKLPHAEIEQLFRRMVFNVVFANHDDHLKNHSFTFDKVKGKWNLSPAYDITYSLNPLINYKRTSRALSINNKRTDINLTDIQYIAKKYTIRNYKNIVESVLSGIDFWKKYVKKHQVASNIIANISRDFSVLK